MLISQSIKLPETQNTSKMTRACKMTHVPVKFDKSLVVITQYITIEQFLYIFIYFLYILYYEIL